MQRANDRFSAVRREHVEQACRELLTARRAHQSGSYFLKFEGIDLPAKRVLREAYRVANGEELPAAAFSGGAFTAKVLAGLGFEVVVKN